MLVQDAMKYQATPIKASKKADLMVISEMKSTKIIWYLTRKHKVGILAFLAVIGFTYDNLLPFAARELFYVLFR